MGRPRTLIVEMIERIENIVMDTTPPQKINHEIETLIREQLHKGEKIHIPYAVCRIMDVYEMLSQMYEMVANSLVNAKSQQNYDRKKPQKMKEIIKEKGLTKIRCQRIKYSRDDNLPEYLFDKKIPNLALRILPDGQKHYILSYLFDGEQRILVLGQPGAMKMREARDAAEKKIFLIRQGIDLFPLEKTSLTKTEQACTIMHE